MNFKEETITYDIYGCARCGQDHLAHEFRKLSNQPLADNRGMYEFWAMCPVKQEPILGMLTIMFEVASDG